VTEESKRLKPQVRFGHREYPVGVRFRIERLAPAREGVELGPLVEDLASFPNPRSWSAVLRRALVPLAEGDGDLIRSKLATVAPRYAKALPTYSAFQGKISKR
jgi:hypothetical protein